MAAAAALDVPRPQSYLSVPLLSYYWLLRCYGTFVPAQPIATAFIRAAFIRAKPLSRPSSGGTLLAYVVRYLLATGCQAGGLSLAGHGCTVRIGEAAGSFHRRTYRGDDAARLPTRLQGRTNRQVLSAAPGRHNDLISGGLIDCRTL